MRTKIIVCIALSVFVLPFACIIIAAGISTTLSTMDRARRSSEAYQAALEAHVYIIDYWDTNRVLPENLQAFFDGPGSRFPLEIRSSIHYSKEEDKWSITVPFNKNELLVFSGIEGDSYSERVLQK